MENDECRMPATVDFRLQLRHNLWRTYKNKRGKFGLMLGFSRHSNALKKFGVLIIKDRSTRLFTVPCTLGAEGVSF